MRDLRKPPSVVVVAVPDFAIRVGDRVESAHRRVCEVPLLPAHVNEADETTVVIALILRAAGDRFGPLIYAAFLIAHHAVLAGKWIGRFEGATVTRRRRSYCADRA